MQNAGMSTAAKPKNITIRDVPSEWHDVLTRRAKRSHRSLESYMRDLIGTHVGRPTWEELFDSIERHEGGRRGGITEGAVKALHAERDRR
jgi:hypothetical protein